MSNSVGWYNLLNDIHCHILYGLDDGSVSAEESVEMAMLAKKGGTGRIIVTPHSNVPDSFRNLWNPGFESMIKNLNEKMEQNNCDLTFYPGQEIFCSDNFLKLLAEGKLITLNNSRYPLVEFDFYEHSASVYYKLDKLIAEGYTPVVAHPERYAFVCENDDASIRLRNMGCLLQINKGSIQGSFGKSAQDAAKRMLRRAHADFVASDAHSPYRRTPYLGDAFEYVAENYSFDYADVLFKHNALCVIENKEIISF